MSKINEYYKNHPEKHPWKRKDKFKSVPCENFKRILKEMDIIFCEEYQPSLDRKFSIDIAFPQWKIAIEINGNQHYESNKTGKLKEYYQLRHEFIEKLGWKIHELYYTLCFDDNKIKELINNILSGKKELFDFNYEEYLIKRLNKGIYKCEDCGVKIYRTSKKCNNCTFILKRKVLRVDIDILLEDVKNLGYRGTGRKYGVSDNSIRKWIKKEKERR